MRLTTAILALLFGSSAALANELPLTLRTMKQAEEAFTPRTFYDATCDAGGCRTAPHENVPTIGTIVLNDSDAPERYALSCRATDAEYQVQTPQYAAARVIPLVFSKAALTRLFGSGTEAETIVRLVGSIAQDIVVEAGDPFVEVAFSGHDMHLAISRLDESCRAGLLKSRTPARMIVERTFATVTLKVKIKDDLPFEELKADLLEIHRLAQPNYLARIGEGKHSGEKRLEISTRNLRLVSFRTSPVEPIKAAHQDWFR